MTFLVFVILGKNRGCLCVGWGGLCSLVGTLGWLGLSVWVTAWAARSLGSVTLIVAVVVLPLCNSKYWTSGIYSCLFLFIRDIAERKVAHVAEVVTGAEACRRAWQFLRKGGS